MKAKLKSKNEKSWTNPQGEIKKFYEVEVECNDKKYGCWQFEKIAALKIGDEIEFIEEEKNGRWSMKLPSDGKGGGFGRGKSEAELKVQKQAFSASYAKDVAVACIEKGIISDSKGIDATIIHYSNLFKGLLEG